jgi:iron complex outermembrane receptor protein
MTGAVRAQAGTTEAAGPHEVALMATRVKADPFDIPAAISSVSADQFRNRSLGVVLADEDATVPGLLARNRSNYAQGQQISMRGVGASSIFGIRGLRI